MGFASDYLEKRALFPEIVSEAPDNLTGIIVVVPAYNEPGICKLLNSLVLCIEPKCKTEVIIVVNAPEEATRESIENNKITLKNIESWKRKNNDSFFRLFAFEASNKSISGWGVGLARKTGMDEAVRRFNSIDNPDGIILNLDADCVVAKNYFVSVYNEFLKKKDRAACSVYFEHPLTGNEFPDTIYRYITLYELHLRYFYQGLAYSLFPYVFHTVGSAIAVKALVYVKAGGMNRRQAGEDFYFIQKLVPSGGYFTINSTTVFPSPRPSFRVPFGTGASIEKLNADSSSILLSYNVLAFKELRVFFGMSKTAFQCSFEELPALYNAFPAGVKSFIDETEWIENMTEIKGNTSSLSSFTKRFFGWFNMFRIVKYLNNVHQSIYIKKSVTISAAELLEAEGLDFSSTEPLDLLLYYRNLEKQA